MGVTKAALDARCLARSIEVSDGNLDDALARYERLRSEFGRGVVRRSARIGAYIEARARPERSWSAEELDQSPERILMEVGTALVDIPELSLEI
jgi:2-polyprenyl-6-methoxyphenol hydroxylase-like FAD-dependent oxidoreductase